MTAALLVFPIAGGCGDGGGKAPTYANVESTIDRSCAISASCHGGSGTGKAQLNFERLMKAGRPVTEALNGVPACEYDAMPRVDPGNPDNSWLWIKLSAEHDMEGNIQFEPDPSWDMSDMRDGCPIRGPMGGVSFGVIMPQSRPPAPLDKNEQTMFREWIEMGAPGPDADGG